MSYELTMAAERDIEEILTTTLTVFGEIQLDSYTEIIDKGLDLVGADPNRAGSSDRSELAAGVRSFHLELAAGRSGGGAHCLYYIAGTLSNGSDGAIVLRALRERMEPKNRIARSLGTKQPSRRRSATASVKRKS
ncbi:hypothetical protein [Salinarimonas sp.]|uniref:hypothetical protein n=1 Tax=Salinarimonas sp. TaxID=2766526 RepID=UPI0032D94320